MTGRASTSSSFHYHFTYDVFLNFRGKDTRHGFTGNLYDALAQKEIRTFFDDEEMRKGDEISHTLLKAIQESRMAITVFSKNYASSTYCLNELVHIHQCIKRKDRPVWPIFYDVEPSEVRYQKGDYGQALARHKINLRADEEKIQSWKIAMHEIASISGIHLNPQGDYEYKFIKRIVKEIYSKIHRAPLHVVEYPVGLDYRLHKMNSLLQLGSNDEVIMVGICGIGGMGKTTIARAVYNAIADNFEGLCFLHDIKENSRKLGLEQLQKRMLLETLGVKIRVKDVHEGVTTIKLRLKQKRILLILDNVDKQDQLQKLAGHCDWFGKGSRIIITTRDTQLLRRHGVERKYEMEAFDEKESLELLSWNAFRNEQVDPSYKKVINSVIHYAQGLPLALEVIGSRLFGLTIREWESAIDVYKQIPHNDIQKALKLSYDGLNGAEREVFLDIACFFKGDKLEHVIDIVQHAHGFDPCYCIKVLVDKCLIKIEKDCLTIHDRIGMNDLIQDMGREIIRQESPNEPGKRSRIWSNQDIVHVLEENTGTDKVSMMISNDLSEWTEVNWDGEALKDMRNLKILIFENLEFSEGPKYLPNSLKVLKWLEYPSSHLPLGFCAKKLAVLDLGRSCIHSVETIKKMPNLSVLNLGGCKYITQIPNLSGLSYLKELWLHECSNLIEIDDSVLELAKLEFLNVQKCGQLKIFPRGIKLPSLRQLHLNYCSSLTNFPEVLENTEITYLELVGTGIEKLPSSICNLTRLSLIYIEPAAREKSIELPSSISLMPELKRISVQANGKFLMEVTPLQCTNIFTLSLSRCNISNEMLRIYIPLFINVRILKLTANDFTTLPACIKECRFLWWLGLSECRHLREVEGIPPDIQVLNARGCISLTQESRNSLLSEELLEVVTSSVIKNVLLSIYFCVPGASFPYWIDHSSKGRRISFWYRNSFPTLCLCALVKPTKHVDLPPTTEVLINAKRVCRLNTLNLYDPKKDVGPINEDHIVVYCLTSNYFLGDVMKQVFQEDDWNYAEIYTYLRSVHGAVKESGIYVLKQNFNMEDIRFCDSFQTLDDQDGELGEVEAFKSSTVRRGKFNMSREGTYKAKDKDGDNLVVARVKSKSDQKALAWDSLWKIRMPKKMIQFIRKILHEGIPTDVECVLCGAKEETLEHIFLQCPFARALWFASGLMLKSDFIRYQSFTSLLVDGINQSLSDDSYSYDRWRTKTLVVTSYYIWKARNKRMREGLLPDPISYLLIIKASLRLLCSLPR